MGRGDRSPILPPTNSPQLPPPTPANQCLMQVGGLALGSQVGKLVLLISCGTSNGGSYTTSGQHRGAGTERVGVGEPTLRT